MDLLEKQKERRTRGLVVIGIAVVVLAATVRLTSPHQIPVADFAVIYASGIPLGAGIAIVVATYKVAREIRGK